MYESFINVGNWIEKWARIQPDRIAVISEGTPYTYRELNRRINRLSRFFLHLGLKKGGRVGVLLRNCKQYIEIFFALSKIGGILVPLNWRLTPSELEFILRDSGADMIIFETEFITNAEVLRKKVEVKTNISCMVGEKVPRSKTPSWTIDYESALKRFPDSDPVLPWTAGDADPHILMYTSGTTGLPKGAVLPHRKTFFNVLNAEICFNLTGDDVVIVSRPMFHSGGLIVEMAPVMYKGGTVIVSRRFSPQEILETIEQYRVTMLELPATVYSFILDQCKMEDHDLSSLKCCFTGGERVPLALLQAFEKKGIIISQIYGLTEASTLFWLSTDMAKEKMGSVGKPVFHGDIRIVNKHGRPVKAGEVGEVVVRGPIVMNGYWKRKDLTAEIIKDGWLHTGDLARIDDDGFTYIVDRKTNMFISGGENVYPAEVEKALIHHPSIVDAAVIGVSDKKWGEVGKAYIVVKDGARVSSRDVTGFLRDNLAGYKIPKHIEFIKKLPKTASGKIQKHLLK
jgi:fatty-acyl-CoA synthase